MSNRGSHAAALQKKLVIYPRDVVLEKPRFGAFQGTDLELILPIPGDRRRHHRRHRDQRLLRDDGS